jgi:hypothetical protein
MMNILIYMEWILISFTNLLFLYPLIVGGIFGSISLYLTKKILYKRNPENVKRAHKVRIPKKIEEPEPGGHNFFIIPTDNPSNPWIKISEKDKS